MPLATLLYVPGMAHSTVFGGDGAGASGAKTYFSGVVFLRGNLNPFLFSRDARSCLS